ncbi:hypothetical protein LAZ67_14002119 [Cordylochernes scorpioides]|uniref:DUF5641 domain-containing protein n=1 Tax=Cordylochernes scorpioides TaxID=51811 RepID=A0ABY6LA80_9ARAC|nr:hypothetical protein LAZ67_14002119 [Cordylochernes scorpioides]
MQNYSSAQKIKWKFNPPVSPWWEGFGKICHVEAIVNERLLTYSYYCGGIVYVGNDIQKRINWPLGLIKKVYLGEDGNYRVAKSRIKSGEIVRPIQRLYPLEIHLSDMEAHGVQNLSEDPSNLNIKNEQQKRNRRSGKNYIDD